MNAQGGLKSSCHRFLSGGTYYVPCQKRLCKIKYGLEGLISNDDRGSRPGSTSTCSRFAIERFAKSNDLSRRRYKILCARSYKQECIYIKKEKIRLFLTGLFSLI